MAGDRGPAIKDVAIVSPIVAGFFVFLRLYSRLVLTRSPGLDDLVAVLTLLASIAYSVLISFATYNGMGRHQWDMDEELTERYRKWIVISSELYCVALMGYKLTILMTYHRIFSVSKRFKYVCWSVMFVVVGYLFCNMITEVAGCIPLKKFWDEKVSGHCVNYLALDITYGIFNVLTDFAIAILPLRSVWRLQMDRKEKIGLSLIFLTGIIAFVVALIRWIIACIDLTATDSSWIAGLTFLWSVLEVNTGLICACSLPLKPLLIKATHSELLSSLFSSRRSSIDKDITKTQTVTVETKRRWPGHGRKSEGSDRAPVLDSFDQEMRRLGQAV
ncbi:MAG: hypothetical protein Q9227_008052 [Pyrenula ochraceoflavens]